MSPRFITAFICTLIFTSISLGVEVGKERQWQVDGVARSAIIYAPATATNVEAPLILAFHGHGGTAQHAARTFGYQALWPEAIVVYMQGLKTPGRLTDPEGQKTGWQHSFGDQQDRDLNFFDAVLMSMKADYKVDQHRIYVTGHSNGGSFTYLLWAHRGDEFAAVAPSAAVMGKGWSELKPKPALHVAGESDPLVKYAWQQLSMQAIRKVNACDPESTPWLNAGTLVGTKYSSRSGNDFVSLIHPGGHQFLSETPKLIVKFFQEHKIGDSAAKASPTK